MGLPDLYRELPAYVQTGTTTKLLVWLVITVVLLVRMGVKMIALDVHQPIKGLLMFRLDNVYAILVMCRQG